jgi:8-oxo-dGTP pyrophosphatase MutT (NUDIX family)
MNIYGEPSPGEGAQYNPGPATDPRKAATVILLRGGGEALEVLLVQRTAKAHFMGGVWVFPGGAVDEDDTRDEDRGDPARALRRAAARELREEAGIVLSDGDELVEFSRWITPAEVRRRFDTHFFLAPLPPGQQPRVDGEECVAYRWFTPSAALAAHGADEIVLVFPTIKHLEQLGRFRSADALLTEAGGRDVEPVQPRVVVEGKTARVLLPGDPDY